MLRTARQLLKWRPVRLCVALIASGLVLLLYGFLSISCYARWILLMSPQKLLRQCLGLHTCVLVLQLFCSEFTLPRPRDQAMLAQACEGRVSIHGIRGWMSWLRAHASAVDSEARKHTKALLALRSSLCSSCRCQPCGLLPHRRERGSCLLNAVR